MLRFNMVQGENKKIRSEIEHMLKDRSVHMMLSQPLLNEINREQADVGGNKLEAAMLRFNVGQEENKKIRSEIEHMFKDMSDRVMLSQSLA